MIINSSFVRRQKQQFNESSGMFERRTALFSTDERYRFMLRIEWNDAKPACVFIGLNPSTADENVDDPTVRRCKRFARDWGAGSLVMLNLFAYRATLPKDMMAVADPIGILPTERILLTDQLGAGAIFNIAAWGNHGLFRNRQGEFLNNLLNENTRLHHLGLSLAGTPKHPLYLKADTKPELWL